MKTLVAPCLFAIAVLTSCTLSDPASPLPSTDNKVTGKFATVSASGDNCCVDVEFTGTENFSSRWFIKVMNTAKMVHATCSDPVHGAVYTVGNTETLCFDASVDIEIVVFGEGGISETLPFKSECYSLAGN